jgi:hypothetical protein
LTQSGNLLECSIPNPSSPMTPDHRKPHRARESKKFRRGPTKKGILHAPTMALNGLLAVTALNSLGCLAQDEVNIGIDEPVKTEQAEKSIPESDLIGPPQTPPWGQIGPVKCPNIIKNSDPNDPNYQYFIYVTYIGNQYRVATQISYDGGNSFGNPNVVDDSGSTVKMDSVRCVAVCEPGSQCDGNVFFTSSQSGIDRVYKGTWDHVTFKATNAMELTAMSDGVNNISTIRIFPKDGSRMMASWDGIGGMDMLFTLPTSDLKFINMQAVEGLITTNNQGIAVDSTNDHAYIAVSGGCNNINGSGDICDYSISDFGNDIDNPPLNPKRPMKVIYNGNMNDQQAGPPFTNDGLGQGDPNISDSNNGDPIVIYVSNGKGMQVDLAAEPGSGGAGGTGAGGRGVGGTGVGGFGGAGGAGGGMPDAGPDGSGGMAGAGGSDLDAGADTGADVDADATPPITSDASDKIDNDNLVDLEMLDPNCRAVVTEEGYFDASGQPFPAKGACSYLCDPTKPTIADIPPQTWCTFIPVRDGKLTNAWVEAHTGEEEGILAIDDKVNVAADKGVWYLHSGEQDGAGIIVRVTKYEPNYGETMGYQGTAVIQQVFFMGAERNLKSTVVAGSVISHEPSFDPPPPDLIPETLPPITDFKNTNYPNGRVSAGQEVIFGQNGEILAPLPDTVKPPPKPDLPPEDGCDCRIAQTRSELGNLGFLGIVVVGGSAAVRRMSKMGKKKAVKRG